MAKETKRRFYRAKLPMVVWDARNNCPLCDFSEGHIITDDEYTIERLLEIGYPEVDLDAVRPPVIIEPLQPEHTPDIRPLPAGLTEKAMAKMEVDKANAPTSPTAGALAGSGTGSGGQKTDAATTGKKPKNTPSKEPKKSKSTSSSKKIKRRSKS